MPPKVWPNQYGGPKLVCIDIQPYTSMQAPDRSDILNVGGFSTLGVALAFGVRLQMTKILSHRWRDVNGDTSVCHNDRVEGVGANVILQCYRHFGGPVGDLFRILVWYVPQNEWFHASLVGFANLRVYIRFASRQIRNLSCRLIA